MLAMLRGRFGCFAPQYLFEHEFELDLEHRRFFGHVWPFKAVFGRLSGHFWPFRAVFGRFPGRNEL